MGKKIFINKDSKVFGSYISIADRRDLDGKEVTVQINKHYLRGVYELSLYEVGNNDNFAWLGEFNSKELVEKAAKILLAGDKGYEIKEIEE